MSLRNHLLAAAVAAASWSVIPALAQQEEELPPSSMPEETVPGEQSTPAQQPTAPEAATPAPGTGATATNLDDKKIEQFADAYIAVQTIQKKAAADLQTATDPAQADKVKASAETDMIAAVERSGLQVEEFNRIVETMASDTQVRSRIAAELEERSSGT